MRVMGDFDPLATLFIAQQHRPAHLEDLNLRTLRPLERALLVIDGTVTRFLEAYMMEPIDIVKLGETQEILSKQHAWLELDEGEVVISRRVLLRGRYSDHVYALAASLVVSGRIKQVVQPMEGMDGDVPEGLGRMLLHGRTEQYRELLWYGKEPSADLPGGRCGLTCQYAMSRTYRIIVQKKPTMMITEWFELGRENLSAEH